MNMFLITNSDVFIQLNMLLKMLKKFKKINDYKRAVNVTAKNTDQNVTQLKVDSSKVKGKSVLLDISRY